MNNFKEFLKEVGQGVAKDGSLLSEKTLEEKREEICKTCSQFDERYCRCYACGCFMKVKWKFENTKCPLAKW